jgi:hypothetical protein
MTGINKRRVAPAEAASAHWYRGGGPGGGPDRLKVRSRADVATWLAGERPRDRLSHPEVGLLRTTAR